MTSVSDAQDKPKQWKPTGVSLSSGGVRVFGHLGVMSQLLEAGSLEEVRDWYGCSGGAMCALFGILGVTSAWIYDAIKHFDTRIVTVVEEDTVADFMNTWGVNDGSSLVEILSSFIETWEPGSSKWTFADLAEKRPGKTLNITAMNVNRGTIAVFNATTTPNMKIVTAVRASSTIPLFYTPWVDASGELFCDGATLEYHPWSCVSDKDNTLVIACSDTGISGRPLRSEPIRSLMEYMGRISFVSRLQRFAKTPKNWIAVNNRNIGTFDFYMTQEDRLNLYVEGKRAAIGWLAFQHSREVTNISREVTNISREVSTKAAAGESYGYPGDRVTPGTLSSAHCNPDKRLDNPQSHNPQQKPYPSLDSRNGEPRPYRRWSL